TSGNGLYVVPSSGGSQRKLAEGALPENQRLGWTPDGSMVGYVAADAATTGRDNAWAVSLSAEGGTPMLITTLQQSAPGRGPAYQLSVRWSPDGKWVLVAGVNNPMRLRRWPAASASSRESRVPSPGSASGTGDSGPATRDSGLLAEATDIPGGEPDWSPDSRTIVYAETLSGALSIYYVIAA